MLSMNIVPNKIFLLKWKKDKGFSHAKAEWVYTHQVCFIRNAKTNSEFPKTNSEKDANK
jgi:hypothetical protein